MVNKLVVKEKRLYNLTYAMQIKDEDKEWSLGSWKISSVWWIENMKCLWYITKMRQVKGTQLYGIVIHPSSSATSVCVHGRTGLFESRDEGSLLIFPEPLLASPSSLRAEEGWCGSSAMRPSSVIVGFCKESLWSSCSEILGNSGAAGCEVRYRKFISQYCSSYFLQSK